MRHRSITRFAIALGALALSAPALAAPAVPSGAAHPRIWLDGSTLPAMKAKLATPGSAAASVVAGCDTILLPEKAGEMLQAGIQGYNWAYSSLTCAGAWQLTRDAKYAAPAVTMFRAMLDDYATIGDAAGGDSVVQHDTGYAIRFYGAYSALMYDWLHDAPGVDATLLAHARERFSAWIDWYDQSGYLNTTPGSNMHAGYVFAKALVAVAQAGEGGNDAYWGDVIDRNYGQQIVGDGLAPHGALAGGDWPEGWQYGTMSTLDLALGARALIENGASMPALTGWADSLAVRYAHAMTPARTAQWAGGDLDDTAVDAPNNPRALLAAIAGPSSAKGAAWAQHLRTAYASTRDQCPVYDALAEARGAGNTDYAASAPLGYVATGTRNFFVRSSWNADAIWSVFTSAPRLVPDHQHFDASNFVLERGADALIADPSPYGSRSSLTSNAMTVDSKAVESSYAPSQSPWGTAELAWANMTSDGIAAARADLAGAFDGNGAPSDVPLARRDWAFLPEGEIVAIDRVRTNDASRGAYVRFRTPASLKLAGGVATGKVGSSAVAIHHVASSSGSPVVQAVAIGDCWDSNAYGACTKGRFTANEYALRLSGPSASAVHVIDATAANEAPSTVGSMNDKTVDPQGANGAVLGAAIDRAGQRTYVVAANSDASVSSLAYGVPGTSARHVVLDGPERATVTAHAVNGRCEIDVAAAAAGSGMEGRPLVFTMSDAASGCAIAESGGGTTPAPGSGDPSSGSGSGSGGASGGASSDAGSPGAGSSSTGGGTSSGDPASFGPIDDAPPGVQCAASPRSTGPAGAAGSVLALLAMVWLGRRARRRAD